MPLYQSKPHTLRLATHKCNLENLSDQGFSDLLGNSVDYGVVLELDMIDKGIIMDLIRNCRVS